METPPPLELAQVVKRGVQAKPFNPYEDRKIDAIFNVDCLFESQLGYPFDRKVED